MTTQWRHGSLGSFVRIERTQGLHVDMPYVGLEDIEPQTGRHVGVLEPRNVKSTTFKFDRRHVLYGRLRAYLNKWLLPEFDGHCSTEIFPLLPAPEVSREWLAYWLATQADEIDATSHGARMPRARMEEVLQFEFPVPPLEEQKRIVTKLDQALGDVDALGATTQSVLDDIDALWSCYLADSFSPTASPNQRTPVSSEWPVVRLGDVADIHNGGTPKTGVADYWDGGLLWVTPAEMGKLSSPYLGTTARTLSPEGMKASNTKLMPTQSVIMSSRAPIGYLVINIEPMSFNQGCKGLIPHDALDHKYLYYFLLSSKDYLNSLGSGTTFAELSAGKLKEVEIPLPPLDEQKRIVAKLNALKSDLDALRNIQITKRVESTFLRSSILSSAFAGDL